MKTINPELLSLEKELKVITRNIDGTNCISCSEKEAEYLMS